MTKGRRAREAGRERASFVGQAEFSGSSELKSADKQPWKYSASEIPEIVAGTLDAPAMLKSINETLLPVVEQKLERMAESLGVLLEGKEPDGDPAAVIRAELMRRVLPQIADSVRSGVMEGIRTRQMHLAQLAAIHRQTLESGSLGGVLTRIDHELSRAGLEIVRKGDDHSLFNVVEDPPGVLSSGPLAYEVAAPAYVDSESGRLVERGWLRAVPRNQLPVPAAEKKKPGQRRRAAHVEADERQKESLKGDQGSSLPKKQSHPSRAPDVKQNPGDSASEQLADPPRYEESGGRAVQKQGSSGGARSSTGSQDTAASGHTQRKMGFRQSLRAAASKQMDQRGTR